jgi:hypothetical protein
MIKNRCSYCLIPVCPVLVAFQFPYLLRRSSPLPIPVMESAIYHANANAWNLSMGGTAIGLTEPASYQL